MATAQNNAPKFRVGDWVSFLYAARQVYARIVEDRGNLGYQRRRIYRIQFDWDAEAIPCRDFEMPEVEMTKIASKSTVVDFMKQGGLISILQENLAGGKKQPRAWLTFDDQGEATYTLEADRGMIGGATIPFYAVHEGKIFLPLQQQVRDWLTTFGLDRDEAEKTIRSVGTSP